MKNTNALLSGKGHGQNLHPEYHRLYHPTNSDTKASTEEVGIGTIFAVWYSILPINKCIGLRVCILGEVIWNFEAMGMFGFVNLKALL